MASRGPVVDRVTAVAGELGDLRKDVVFIGAAIAPLLQTDPPFSRSRPTTDVDAIVASRVYSDYERWRTALSAHGFRQDIGNSKHIHRWVGPSGIPFDLVPAGDHLAGSGNPWDAIAIETAAEAELAGGIVIRHASAPAFLAQKWAAYRDRGTDDPLLSDDLEDILALLASRPAIAKEVAAAPPALREYVGQQARAFLDSLDAEDLLAAHLNNAQDPAGTITAVRDVLRQLAEQISTGAETTR